MVVYEDTIQKLHNPLMVTVVRSHNSTIVWTLIEGGAHGESGFGHTSCLFKRKSMHRDFEIILTQTYNLDNTNNLVIKHYLYPDPEQDITEEEFQEMISVLERTKIALTNRVTKLRREKQKVFEEINKLTS